MRMPSLCNKFSIVQMLDWFILSSCLHLYWQKFICVCTWKIAENLTTNGHSPIKNFIVKTYSISFFTKLIPTYMRIKVFSHSKRHLHSNISMSYSHWKPVAAYPFYCQWQSDICTKHNYILLLCYVFIESGQVFYSQQCFRQVTSTYPFFLKHAQLPWSEIWPVWFPDQWCGLHMNISAHYHQGISRPHADFGGVG